mmetsp:Transcript_4816/g.11744  ORF Transcript_4816/g.11744 Transcript_4816/m.11744 type:complete len:531 (-) Transcript_4816:174-1766(-)
MRPVHHSGIATCNSMYICTIPYIVLSSQADHRNMIFFVLVFCLAIVLSSLISPCSIQITVIVMSSRRHASYTVSDHYILSTTHRHRGRSSSALGGRRSHGRHVVHVNGCPTHTGGVDYRCCSSRSSRCVQRIVGRWDGRGSGGRGGCWSVRVPGDPVVPIVGFLGHAPSGCFAFPPLSAETRRSALVVPGCAAGIRFHRNAVLVRIGAKYQSTAFGAAIVVESHHLLAVLPVHDGHGFRNCRLVRGRRLVLVHRGWQRWGHPGLLLGGGRFLENLGMVLDFPVPVDNEIKVSLAGPRVHPRVLFPDLDVDSQLFGYGDPIDALVVFLGDGVVLGPQVLRVGYDPVQIGSGGNDNGGPLAFLGTNTFSSQCVHTADRSAAGAWNGGCARQSRGRNHLARGNPGTSEFRLEVESKHRCGFSSPAPATGPGDLDGDPVRGHQLGGPPESGLLLFLGKPLPLLPLQQFAGSLFLAGLFPCHLLGMLLFLEELSIALPGQFLVLGEAALLPLGVLAAFLFEGPLGRLGLLLGLGE